MLQSISQCVMLSITLQIHCLKDIIFHMTTNQIFSKTLKHTVITVASVAFVKFVKFANKTITSRSGNWVMEFHEKNRMMFWPMNFGLI